MVIPVLAAVGTFLAFPPLGLVAGGPIAAALGAAGTAGLVAGLIGVFSEWGIPEERAQEYEVGIHDGGILMGVKARTDEDARYFEQQWKAIGGSLVHS